MKVLVTGANGFLGRHLLEVLSREHEVVGMCRREMSLGVACVQGDVTDEPSLVAAFEGCEAVIHAAGSVSHRAEDAALMWSVHVEGTANVLSACRKAGVRRLVHVSSSGTIACSRDMDPVANEASPSPLTLIQSWPYYRCKLFSEQAVLAAEDIEVVCLNPSLLLGPGDRTGGATSSVRYFLEDRLSAIPSGRLSFVDVRDVAVAAALALEKGEPGQRYLLGATNMTFVAFYERLARITNRDRVRWNLPSFTKKVLNFFPELGAEAGLGFGKKIPRMEVLMACHNWAVDAGRAKRELSWRPRDPTQTLRDTVVDLIHPAPLAE